MTSSPPAANMAVSQRPEQLFEVGLFAAADHEGSQDGRDDACASQQHREYRLGVGEFAACRARQGHRAGGKGHGRNNGTNVGLEQVGTHSRDVSDVVTHVVGDDAGVTGVILGDTGFDLTNQV